jgi:hypothetical protein
MNVRIYRGSGWLGGPWMHDACSVAQCAVACASRTNATEQEQLPRTTLPGLLGDIVVVLKGINPKEPFPAKEPWMPFSIPRLIS